MLSILSIHAEDFPVIIENKSYFNFETKIDFTAYIPKMYIPMTSNNLMPRSIDELSHEFIKIEYDDIIMASYTLDENDYYFIVQGFSILDTQADTIQVIQPTVYSYFFSIFYTIQTIEMCIPYLQESIVFKPIDQNQRYILIDYDQENGLLYSLQTTPSYVKNMHIFKKNLVDFFVSCWLITEETLPY